MRHVVARPRWRAPGLDTLRHYPVAWWRGDVVAGLTVAAYLVPQVMAYSSVAGLPVASGLWAAIVSLVVYSVVGSSRQLSVGPESSTALLSAVIIAPVAGQDPARHAMLSAALAVLLGVYCLLAWLLRLGFVADLLSRPVLVGYLAGLALVMTAGQLERVTGIRTTGSTFLAQVHSFGSGLGGLHGPTTLLAAATLLLLVGFHRVWPRAPGPLLVLLLATLGVVLLDLENRGVALVGQVTGALPRVPEATGYSDLQLLLLPAVGLLVLGYADNVLTARAFAGPDEEIDANQELLALGMANIGSGLGGGFAVSSSASRTALGAAVGARTQLYSLVCAGTVVLVLAAGRPLLAHFPAAALGALVIFAASHLVDLRELRRLARFRRSELLLACSATVGVLLVDLLYGVLVAIALSVADLLSRVARPHDAILGRVPGLAGMHDIDDYPLAEQIPGLVVYRYDSPLFFANAADFHRRALAAAQSSPGVVWFVLNMEANTEVDITGLDALESLRATLAAQGIVVALARVKQELLRELTRYGLTDALGPDRIYATLPTAIAAYTLWSEAS